MSDGALPAPLVPPEVDLRDFGFMPLDVQRLRDSDLAAEETPAACWAALLLWCAGWHQVPAGSIPDSERWQAKHAGYLAHGEINPRWQDVREGALRGWVLCSDGRLYHPVIAEKALESWKAKLAQRERTRAATEAREAKRRAALAERDVQRDVERDEHHVGDRDVHQGTGTVKGQGQGIEEKHPTDALARPAVDRPQLALVDSETAPKSLPDCPHGEILALWADVLPALPQHLASQWRGTRAAHLRARWRETAVEKGWQTQAEGLAYFRKLFAWIGRSPFLTGRAPGREGRHAFVIELAWLVSPTNWAKVLEGKFHEGVA